MGCCQNKDMKTEDQKAEGSCCGGAQAKKESCCGGSKIAGFFKMIFGKKCCGSAACKN